MREFLYALGLVVKIIFFTIVHLVVMIPLSLLCLLLSIALLPIDGVAYVLSLGQLRLEIFWAFQTAARTMFTWYRRAVKN